MEPARNDHYDDEEESPSRPQLRAIEGGGEKSEPSGQLRSMPAGGVYDTNDKTPITRPNLQALEGGGQTTSKSRGHLQSVSDSSTSDKASPSSQGSTSDFGFRHEDDSKPKGLRGKIRNLSKKRKRRLMAIGGGVAGLGGLLGALFFLAGVLLLPDV